MADCTLEQISRCTHHDPAAAERLLLGEVAQHNSPKTLRQLADFYRTAPERFRDLTRATWYYRRAAMWGDPAALMALGEIKTSGSASDASVGVAYLKRAASAGLPGPAFRKLAEYYRGIGDYDKALAALRQAADSGDTIAVQNLTITP